MCPLVVTIAFLLCKETDNTRAKYVVPSTDNPKPRCLSAYPIMWYLPLSELLAAHPFTQFFPVFDSKTVRPVMNQYGTVFVPFLWFVFNVHLFLLETHVCFNRVSVQNHDLYNITQLNHNSYLLAAELACSRLVWFGIVCAFQQQTKGSYNGGKGKLLTLLYHITKKKKKLVEIMTNRTQRTSKNWQGVMLWHKEHHHVGLFLSLFVYLLI